MQLQVSTKTCEVNDDFACFLFDPLMTAARTYRFTGQLCFAKIVSFSGFFLLLVASSLQLTQHLLEQLEERSQPFKISDHPHYFQPQLIALGP